MQLGSLLSTRG